jgi:hypothetical protein
MKTIGMVFVAALTASAVTGPPTDYGNLAHYQISRQTWELPIAIFRPAILYGDVLMFDISGLR